MSGQKRCRCGKTIVFGENEHGKRIPLDVSAPVYLVVSQPLERPIRVVRELGSFVNHYETCALALRFKKQASPHAQERWADEVVESAAPIVPKQTRLY